MPNTLGEAIGKWFSLKKEKEDLNNDIKALNIEIDQLEQAIIKEMDSNGIEKASCDKGTVWPDSKLWSRVDNWEKFLAWVRKNDAWHFLTRKPNDGSVRELHSEAGVLPDGVLVHIKRTLHKRGK
jgi:hypothetical protein